MDRNSQISNILFSVLIILSFSSAEGSEISTYNISGIIINHETGAPIQLAEVFISGTTNGCITDENGEFELQTGYLPCKLVASHISYSQFSMMIDKESINNVNIKLIPYRGNTDEISVEAVKIRKENLMLFKKALLGMDEFANSCTILNDSVLSFKWNPMVFSASARQPILIDHPKLGFLIKIVLKKFILIYDRETYQRIRSKKMPPSVNDAVNEWLCDSYFIPYSYENKRKQKTIVKNRLRIYYGSKIHFLRTLYSGYPKENGYYIKPDFESIPISGDEDFDTIAGVKIIFLDQTGIPDKLLSIPERSMTVTYFEKFAGEPMDLTREDWTGGIAQDSEIIFGSEKCFVRYNGTTFDYSLTYKGYFGNQKISTLLPYNFSPIK